MLQLEYALNDYKRKIGLMITFSIQLIILFISIMGISDDVFKSYFAYRTMKELYVHNKNCTLYKSYDNSEVYPNSMENVYKGLKKVLVGQDEAKAVTYYISENTVYIFGNWKRIESFKNIPYTSGEQTYGGRRYNLKNYKKLKSTILLTDSAKGNAVNIDKSRIVFINERIWNDDSFKMDFSVMKQMVNNLIMFTGEPRINEEYINSINSNIGSFIIVPISVKEVVNGLKTDFFFGGGESELLLFLIIFVFSIICGLISLIYIVIDKNMKEYAIHFLVGATISDIWLRELLLLNIMILPGLLLSYSLYAKTLMFIDLNIITIIVYLTLMLGGLLPLYIRFNCSKNKLDFTRRDLL
ncbi:hypothetical protein EQM13_07305 [Acidilutibacter cellobiosedens]|uniref:Uncharacterized protein n=1 Tax=Acidilutibacter cellobiosedens TaxID=2507161 RepID=A0A410QBQ0_9FIRM|nr:hypothetical protein [Acidilutibacter cellobiosedens]QAT61397.1 hypothetical protein EQM13_07305 [Acidilutibacter cellobiosedens]